MQFECKGPPRPRFKVLVGTVSGTTRALGIVERKDAPITGERSNEGAGAPVIHLLEATDVAVEDPHGTVMLP